MYRWCFVWIFNIIPLPFWLPSRDCYIQCWLSSVYFRIMWPFQFHLLCFTSWVTFRDINISGGSPLQFRLSQSSHSSFLLRKHFPLALLHPSRVWQWCYVFLPCSWSMSQREPSSTSSEVHNLPYFRSVKLSRNISLQLKLEIKKKVKKKPMRTLAQFHRAA